MSSSQDMYECPKCKGIMMVLDDFSTYETTQWCLRCGAYYDRSVVWTRNWEPVYENGKPKYKETSFDGGFGVLRLSYPKEVITDSFDMPLTEEQVREYQEKFDSGLVNKEDSFLIMVVGGKFECVFGTVDDMMLLDYEEYWNRNNEMEAEAE